jgi:hypothetical protein
MNNELMFSSQNQAWDTPQDFYDKLDEEFHFDLDPCCTYDNCKCDGGFSFDAGMDGLTEKWSDNVFMNPPYNREYPKWVAKAVSEVDKGNAKLVVGLLPARTDTIVFHKYIWDGKLHKPRPGVGLRFPKGRLTFGSDEYWEWVWEQEFIGTNKDGSPKKNSLYKKYGKKNSAPFPSMVVIWRSK